MIINKNNLFLEFFEKINENRKIDFLIIHHIEAPNISHAIKLLNQHKVSSHYLIDTNGEIFQLVDDNNISYHAGVSYFRGYENLNKNSIGVELLNHCVEKNKFSDPQIDSLIKLCHSLIVKHNIPNKNIIGHSDIAYCKETNFLDRKQDPSKLFNWEKLYKNNLGIFSLKSHLFDYHLFKLGDIDEKISFIKHNLKKFGYKITNENNLFDEEMIYLTRVFNRHFNPSKNNLDLWYKSSNNILKDLVKKLG